jgi:hypothetical protein
VSENENEESEVSEVISSSSDGDSVMFNVAECSKEKGPMI